MLNHIILMGRLTREPELKTVGEKQTSVVRFTLAVNRPKFGDAEPEADFIPVVAWRGTAEFISRNFHKGKQVYVVGRLQTRKWEKDGVTHYGFEVVTNEVGFADSVSKQGGQANATKNQASDTTGGFPMDNDFPIGDDFSGENGFPDVFGGDSGNDDNLPF